MDFTNEHEAEEKEVIIADWLNPKGITLKKLEEK